MKYIVTLSLLIMLTSPLTLANYSVVYATPEVSADQKDDLNIPHMHDGKGNTVIVQEESKKSGVDAIAFPLIAAILGGFIVSVINYFMKKNDKVDDLPSVYATKADVEKIKDKIENIKETYIQKETCKGMRNDCAGKNWAESFKRMEDTFNAKLDSFDRKFEELNSLLLEVMKELGYYKGRHKTSEKI